MGQFRGGVCGDGVSVSGSVSGEFVTADCDLRRVVSSFLIAWPRASDSGDGALDVLERRDGMTLLRWRLVYT